MKMMGAKDLSELGPRFVSIRPHHVCLPEVLPLTSPTLRSTPAWWSGIFSTATPGWTGQDCGLRPAPSCERIEMCLPRMRGTAIVLCFGACSGVVGSRGGMFDDMWKRGGLLALGLRARAAGLIDRGLPGACFG
jgi:hypothetical protein